LQFAGGNFEPGATKVAANRSTAARKGAATLARKKRAQEHFDL
jgi:hypothetical protein